MKTKLITIFISCISTPYLQASDLSYFLELGVKNNPSHLIRIKELEKSQNTLKMRYSIFLPTLDAEFSESKTKRNDQMENSSEAKLNMDLNLYNGGADSKKVSIAKLNIKMSKENMRRELSDIVYHVKQEYFNTIYATELKSLLLTIVARREKQFNFIHMRFEGGREDKGNYLLAKVKLKKAKLEVTHGQRLFDNSIKKLANNIGLSVQMLKQPEGSLQKYINFSKDYFRQDFTKEIKNVPEILIANYEVAIAKNNTSVARAAFLPKVELNSSIGKTGVTYNDLDTNSTSIGITVKIPLFSGGSDIYNTKNAKLERINKEHWQRKSEINLITKITEAKNSFSDSLENMELQQDILEASKIRAKVASGKYTAGLMDYTTWDLIQEELINNEKNMLTALKLTLLEKAKLDNILGIGVAHE